MVVHTIVCPFCSRPESVVKHEANRGGIARCRCQECRKTFTPHPNPRQTAPETLVAVERCLEERIAWNAIKRTLGVSWARLNAWLKKAQRLNATTVTWIQPSHDAVEMDELCVSKRQNRWLWTSVSRYTGQVLCYRLGDCGHENAGLLRNALLVAWQKRRVYTDGYKAYAAYLPAWRHVVCPKGDGGTNTVEGVNNSLRHRCGLLVRRHSGSRATKNLSIRVLFAVTAHNKASYKRWHKWIDKSTQSGE